MMMRSRKRRKRKRMRMERKLTLTRQMKHLLMSPSLIKTWILPPKSLSSILSQRPIMKMKRMV